MDRGSQFSKRYLDIHSLRERRMVGGSNGVIAWACMADPRVFHYGLSAT